MTPHPKHGRVWRKAQRQEDARPQRRGTKHVRRASVARAQAQIAAEVDAARLRLSA